jgi:hypothetical protein
LVRHYLETKELTDGMSVLYTRSEERGLLLRIHLEEHSSVLVKLWKNRNRIEQCKCLLGISNGQHEWRIHRLVQSSEARVAIPLDFGNFQLPCGDQFEAMLIQDLGEVTIGVEYLKKCILSEDTVSASLLEEATIQFTQCLLRLRITDLDNHLTNFVVDSNRSVFRIDFECAREWRFRKMSNSAIGNMIGRLIGTHVFACQGIDLSRSRMFADQLANTLQLEKEAMQRASGVIEKLLERQRDSGGPNTVFTCFGSKSKRLKT